MSGNVHSQQRICGIVGSKLQPHRFQYLQLRNKLQHPVRIPCLAASTTIHVIINFVYERVSWRLSSDHALDERQGERTSCGVTDDFDELARNREAGEDVDADDIKKSHQSCHE
ncbi:hypothetical protein pipiens_008193 [Culex pipiens pipiens]|uniref:Uncharacterized protein n=1 Tax=Culex pipiens pipiens TaxID=38569 RepID=A0ABD1DM26_CULPP